MRAFTLDHLSDDNLLAGLAALVATDRQTTAAMLAHLAEVEARGLYRPAACSSMHAYCVRVLRLSEDAASKRLRAARVARQWPQIFEAVADGRLHLSAVVMLAPHFKDANVDELVAAAAYRTKVEIEMLVATLAPQPDLPAAVVPLDPMGGAEQANPSAPGRIPPALGRPPAPVATRVKPLAPERFGLQVTISQETHEKLERAQALLRHRNPRGDLAEVIDRALDALLITLEREKFGATSRPRAAKPRADDADPRYVSREVRRSVHARDGEQCSFVSADGVRCTERGFLEFDHSTPVALGGQPTADGTRLLCHAHNQYEAERRLGADFMRAKRRE
ncbi:MAG: HNH endonuclease, partial [Actinomycetota bacterium]